MLNEKCSDMDQLKALFQIEIIEFAFSQNVQHAPALNVAKKALEKCMLVNILRSCEHNATDSNDQFL